MKFIHIHTAGTYGHGGTPLSRHVAAIVRAWWLRQTLYTPEKA